MRRVLGLFFAKHVAALALLLLAAAGAGTLAAGPRERLALRIAIGLALCAHALFFLGVAGQLRPVPLIAFTLVVIAGGAIRARGIRRVRLRELAIAIGGAPLFVLALFPPLAFDETLYHLPFVREFAGSGSLGFLPRLRFPVFPQLHEVLCVPLFLLAGDTGTHLVALAEVIITAALLVEWGRRHDVRTGLLAAAVFLGSPLVVHLATILYTDAALTLFVAAAFYALDRERFALAGFFLGTACGVKYLGGFFALAALIIIAIRARDRLRASLLFATSCAAAALPTTAWIALNSGNPLFPFLGSSPWAHALPAHIAWSDRAVRIIRLMWDVTFARERTGLQPPITPLLPLLVCLVAAAAMRDARARWVAIMAAAYAITFTFLPPDSRYLVPLIPLLSIAAATIAIARWPKAFPLVACLALAPGLAYAGHRLRLYGMPPSGSEQRSAWLAQRVPAYRAVTRAGSERIYVCGGEQLKSYAAGELLGDFVGPWSYERVLGNRRSTSEIAERMIGIDAGFYLVAKRACGEPIANGGMDLVHDDEGAQLWRVQR
ncbi:MAG: glycosyltransferase family 39 protein [Thermoanaerobaculia bacterium]|nr:glycosyltransferase family 39 protein [Thermoanaerobaculia bacterium]